MRENGKMIDLMVMDLFIIQMELNMKVIVILNDFLWVKKSEMSY